MKIPLARAGLLAPACLFAAVPVEAQETAAAAPPVDLSLTVSAVSDYRYRGVSLSQRAPVVQGSLTAAHRTGLYANGWVSSIAGNEGAGIETQAAVGYAATHGGIGVDAWAAYYVYPGAEQDNYGELSAKLQRNFGPAQLGIVLAYAPAQSQIGGTDNVYVGVESLWAVPDTPITLMASAGWEDGAFGDGKLDWTLGAQSNVAGFDFALRYVDAARTQGDPNARAAILLSVARTF